LWVLVVQVHRVQTVVTLEELMVLTQYLLFQILRGHWAIQQIHTWQIVIQEYFLLLVVVEEVLTMVLVELQRVKVVVQVVVEHLMEVLALVAQEYRVKDLLVVQDLLSGQVMVAVAAVQVVLVILVAQQHPLKD
jgi:hypothetical protein